MTKTGKSKDDGIILFALIAGVVVGHFVTLFGYFLGVFNA